ncbi:hypothetical protein PHLGIDRAFT_128016 [Phlebiopsis gigantea 11061_1 CR5-6]|uniref:histone acetyltransferase n=1 Tax=Phlebiopsis gigantea (strain 11061_1 CR5-6) TaxID=745531 RepID=A0A0C3S7L2_PHLG1|nr:hypothetical protein PHLGIDRAFT_128016 [Phlebiopsis gigantea 11061_1 CR5-6]
MNNEANETLVERWGLPEARVSCKCNGWETAHSDHTSATAMAPSTHNLRDALLSALKTLPGTREFYLHVLVSSPYRHTGLFPYAHPRPRVYLQEVFVLLSERASPESPRQLVSAVELFVYTVPATSCGVLHVSKVDSTGQGTAPPPTSTLVKTLLSYYADPATRPIRVDTLWIQLFARAQNQYLFPNSSEHPGKRPLSDVKLCAWWKRVLGEVASASQAKSQDAKLGLYYLLPGYNELEAINSLHTVSLSANTVLPVQWVYGHQYSQTELPLPCPPSQGVHNLGHSIPSFDDDPKSRFMDEIAHTTEGDIVKSPERKRPRNGSKSSAKDKDKAAARDTPDESNAKEYKPEGELQKVAADEFWERMSFRQECVSGAVTGFFALGISTPAVPADAKPTSSSVPPPLAPQPGQVAPNLVRRVVASLTNGHEFSTVERAARATEALEGSIKGLCENIAANPAGAAKSPASLAPLLFQREETLEPSSAAAAAATLEVPRTPPPKRGGAPLPDLTPNPFPEPIASLETYHSHIYGSVSVANPPLRAKAGAVAAGADGASGDGGRTPAQPVTVLTARKKKRKIDS